MTPGEHTFWSPLLTLCSAGTTLQVYRATTEGIIRKVTGGFNGTVFAYGQTSSGKTHTMLGTAREPGIVPLAVRAIFDHIEATQDREFLLRVSYMEVRSRSDLVNIRNDDGARVCPLPKSETPLYACRNCQ